MGCLLKTTYTNDLIPDWYFKIHNVIYEKSIETL